MSDLISYLWAQAQRQPLATAQFAAGELWRRGRIRLANSLERNLPSFSTTRLHERLHPFLPAAALDTATFRNRYPFGWEATIETAEQICEHQFDIFGERVACGLAIDWHADWRAQHRWPLEPVGELRIMEAAPGADVKRPWELSRFHHLLTLGKASLLTGDPRYAAEFSAQVLHWLRDNPYPRGIHWAMPMEAAIRATNWATTAAFFEDDETLTKDFWHVFLRALFLHGRHIFAHREWNPVARGNHYLACVVGLLHLGVLFRDTSEGQRWLKFARRALAEEMGTQVGDDGVAHEGSSAYHAFVTELLLTGALLLARLGRQKHFTGADARVEIVQSWGESFADRLERMFDFLAALSARRTRLPLWGDCDDGRLLPLCLADAEAASHLLSVGRLLFARRAWPASDHTCEQVWWRLGVKPQDGGASPKDLPKPAAQPEPSPRMAFPSAGFFFFASPRLRGSIRCGPLGVNGWANHSHCDQLSFEFCWEGHPIVVDPGTFAYSGDGAGRDLFRSTRYHNTVVVAGAEQNRFWPLLPFRMVHDTRSQAQHWQVGPAGVEFVGEHFGYRRLPEEVRVSRRLQLDAQHDILLVWDRLDGCGSARVEWFFHLAPGLLPQQLPVPLAQSGCVEPKISNCLQTLVPALADLTFRSAWRLGPVYLLVWASTAAGGFVAGQESGWVAPRYAHRVAAPILRFGCGAKFPVRAAFAFGPFGDSALAQTNSR